MKSTTGFVELLLTYLNSNRAGNNSSARHFLKFLGDSASTQIIAICPPNSAINCRQAPQGVASGVAATAINVNSDSPSETALQIAVRSAQIASPYDAFSTLQPVLIFSDFVNTAAPTAKFEYGEYEFFRAASAASTSSCSIGSNFSAFVKILLVLNSVDDQFWSFCW